MRKIFGKYLLLAWGVVIIGTTCVFAVSSGYKNNLLNLDLKKDVYGNVNLTVYSTKKIEVLPKPIKKSDKEYLIVLPDTFHSLTSKPDILKVSGIVEDVDVKLFPYTNMKTNNGYTKITLKTVGNARILLKNESIDPGEEDAEINNLVSAQSQNKELKTANNKSADRPRMAATFANRVEQRLHQENSLPPISELNDKEVQPPTASPVVNYQDDTNQDLENKQAAPHELFEKLKQFVFNDKKWFYIIIASGILFLLVILSSFLRIISMAFVRGKNNEVQKDEMVERLQSMKNDSNSFNQDIFNQNVFDLSEETQGSPQFAFASVSDSIYDPSINNEAEDNQELISEVNDETENIEFAFEVNSAGGEITPDNGSEIVLSQNSEIELHEFDADFINQIEAENAEYHVEEFVTENEEFDDIVDEIVAEDTDTADKVHTEQNQSVQLLANQPAEDNEDPEDLLDNMFEDEEISQTQEYKTAEQSSENDYEEEFLLKEPEIQIEDEDEDVEPTVVLTKEIDENKTLYLIELKGQYSLIGIMNETVFVLHKFKEAPQGASINIKLNETRQSEKIYITQVGKWRALISISSTGDDYMKYILTL